SVDDLEGARAEPYGDLESDDSQGAGDSKADEGGDPPLDHFRACVAAALPWKKASLKVARSACGSGCLPRRHLLSRNEAPQG
ncbi:unnamed protein product, partial [Ectocarpus sp. 12 AP-2014]